MLSSTIVGEFVLWIMGAFGLLLVIIMILYIVMILTTISTTLSIVEKALKDAEEKRNAENKESGDAQRRAP